MAGVVPSTVRRVHAVVARSVAVILALATVWHAPRVEAQDAIGQDAIAHFDPAVRPEYREPVTLASKDGVLEVTLTAHQGHARLDTVAKPVQNMLVFGYTVIRGTASNGADVGRQFVSRADAASLSGRDADRAFRERTDRADDPRFLRSALHREG